MGKYGPNVTKLITRFIAREAIEPGGGLADAIEFLQNPERRKQVLAKAEADVLEAIQAIKAAPDNPYGDNDEKIAEAVLKEIEVLRKKRKDGT